MNSNIQEELSNNSIDDDGKEKMQKLIDRLEELDDVAEVYHNAEM